MKQHLSWLCLDRSGVISTLLPAVFAAASSVDKAIFRTGIRISLRENDLSDIHLVPWSAPVGPSVAMQFVPASVRDSLAEMSLLALIELDLSDNKRLGALPDLHNTCPSLRSEDFELYFTLVDIFFSAGNCTYQAALSITYQLAWRS